MTASAYRNAILSIAAEALTGEDIDDRIVGLAAATALDPSMISLEVNEAIDLLAD